MGCSEREWRASAADVRADEDLQTGRTVADIVRAPHAPGWKALALGATGRGPDRSLRSRASMRRPPNPAGFHPRSRPAQGASWVEWWLARGPR